MLDIVSQVIKYYLENNKIPTKNDLIIKDNSLLEKRGNIFVTIYKNGNIAGNSGNIIEIENNLVNELIKNTIYALGDERFPDFELSDLDKIKIRIDVLTNRILLGGKTITDKNGKKVQNQNYKEIKDLNPVKSGILVIKKDYNKLSVILPNISSTLTSGKEFETILSKKLDEDFIEDDYIIYEIQTNILSNY